MNSIDVANYIVTKQIENGNLTNTISLQKIIYLVNAKFMQEKDESVPLFDDQLQKWKYGPVSPEVYHEYKLFGAMDISMLPTSQFFYWEKEDFVRELTENKGISKELLDEWIDEFTDAERFDLVDLTHEHNCWKVDSDKIKNGEQNIPYDYNEIFQEMKSNPDLFFKGTN